MESLQRRLAVARGDDPADLVVRGGRVLSVFTREWLHADVAVVFRGRLIGRAQAAQLAEAGIPVVEILTSAPTTPSTRHWIKLSNRIAKPDLVQVVHSLANGSDG